MKLAVKQWSWLAVLSTAATIIVNALANILPLNGITSAARSDEYLNLFAPAGFTFSIWGIIYTFLIAYALRQIWLTYTVDGRDRRVKITSRINALFVLTNLINLVWVFTWHYDYIGASLLLIIGLLITLAKIHSVLRTSNMSNLSRLWLYVPFSIYFSWITVATIANTVTWFVSIGWKGAGIAPEVWTALLLIVGACILAYGAFVNRDWLYSAVGVWAFYGIMSKHLASGFWEGQYPVVVWTAVVAIFVLVIVTAQVMLRRIRAL